MILIVLSGAAVRLTGSGLGCPDWPTCFRHRLSGSLSIHPLIEYTNRMVTVSLVILTGVTFVAALLRLKVARLSRLQKLIQPVRDATLRTRLREALTIAQRRNT